MASGRVSGFGGTIERDDTCGTIFLSSIACPQLSFPPENFTSLECSISGARSIFYRI